MTRDFALVQAHVPGVFSPYRIRGPGPAVDRANAFLDDLAVRECSVRSLRSYGYSLLDALRWAFAAGKDILSLREEDLRDYVRFQKARSPAVSTINHRLSVLSAFSRHHREKEIPLGVSLPRARERSCFTRRGAFRLKGETRLIRPLPSAQLRAFAESFRTWRDLSILRLMLLSGLRSLEVIGLTLDDLSLETASLRVRGKGRKERIVPLSPKTLPILSIYLETERPESRHRALFLLLKGPRRGCPMTSAGLRSLFRHHRRRTAITAANPHRFRHTFGTRCITAGMSLPVLKTILGHSHIDTTLRYVHVSDPDIAWEFERVMRSMRREEDNVH